MKSRITIEVDFENGNQPVIIANLQSSDDVRDKLLKSFIEKFAHQRSWCQVNYMGEALGGNAYKIIPIEPKNHSEQGNLMKMLGDSEFPKSAQPFEVVDGVPRRNRLDKCTAEEIAITEIMKMVETMGYGLKLTSAINLLSQARNEISDYVESKDVKTPILDSLAKSIKEMPNKY